MVAREGKDCTSERLKSGDTGGVEDDDGADGKDNRSIPAKDVVEEGDYGLVELACEDDCGVTHGETQDNVEEPANDVGQGHGEEDGPGSLDLWFIDFLGNVSSRAVNVSVDLLACSAGI